LSGSERDIGAAVDRFVAGQDWTDALSTGDLVLARPPVSHLSASRRRGADFPPTA